MGRMITFDTGWQSVSVVQDLFELKLASTQSAILHSARIMQSSEEASTEAEQLKISIKRATGSFTSGSGGGSATIIKATGDAAHGLTTVERNNTTQAVVGTGTLEEIDGGSFAVLAGEWEKTYTPELRKTFGPSEAVILSLEETPADVLTLRAWIDLEITHG